MLQGSVTYAGVLDTDDQQMRAQGLNIRWAMWAMTYPLVISTPRHFHSPTLGFVCDRRTVLDHAERAQSHDYFLEEAGLEYQNSRNRWNIGKSEQFIKADFSGELSRRTNRDSPPSLPTVFHRLTAASRSPVFQIRRHSCFYPADKTGKFVPKNLRGLRVAALEWLFWQYGRPRPDVETRTNQLPAITATDQDSVRDGSRCATKVNRLYGVMNKRLAVHHRLSRRRIFDRRHGVLSVGGAVGAPGPRSLRISRTCSSWVRSHQGALPRRAVKASTNGRCQFEDQSRPGRHLLSA